MAFKRLVRFAVGDRVSFGDLLSETGSTYKVRKLTGDPFTKLQPTEEIVNVDKLNVPKYPPIFVKPADALAGPFETIDIHPDAREMLDYEGELTVVVGRDAKNISEEEALDYVLGYTAGNDLSARNFQIPEASGMQFGYSKSFDQFGPIGHTIVAASEIPDPQNLRLVTRVNGQVKQQTSTNDMIWSVQQIVSHLSRGMTLRKGTVIMTGTPAGVGFFNKDFLKAGDVVEVEIEGVASVKNEIRPASRRHLYASSPPEHQITSCIVTIIQKTETTSASRTFGRGNNAIWCSFSISGPSPTKVFQAGTCIIGPTQRKSRFNVRIAEGSIPDNSQGGTGVLHVTPPTTESGLEGPPAATLHPVSPSVSSPSTSNIATIRTPSNYELGRVGTATVSGGNDLNVSAGFDFPITYSQDTGVDLQVNEGLDLSGVPSVELESGWVSWLMGDKFDLDAVNSSLLQATAGEFLAVDRMPDENPVASDSFGAGPQATGAGLVPSGDAIREKWHTNCEQSTSGAISPDPANDRNQIDDTYRHELAMRLEQRVQTGILPSTTFLVSFAPFFLHGMTPSLWKSYKGIRRKKGIKD
ncbi:uncharacterized protein N7477_001909 [Penicillium maclennaniae]|uniref:uncharacterized protein n=1 Tax=Penicillium maclennaniae TaxID=1343394 RepID=UPI0025402519|nr:uncharacterized protein N7477_001909 [Penicillium maclennaniae]KAJ5681969.1 hypothetical protein N7477_001909 [Penicillium maclennaniae]